MSRWILTGILGISLSNAAQAFCPLGIGLPLLFGTDAPNTDAKSYRPGDGPPLIDFRAVSGLDEAQEPPNRAELAKECLKAWRRLIADGKFDIAPAVAAKAVTYDPTNIDARHAVVVSQVLRDMNAKQRRENTAFAASPKPETINTMPRKGPQAGDFELFEETTIDDAIVKATLKHMFPGGLLGTCPATCPMPRLEAPPKIFEQHRAIVAGTSCPSSQCVAPTIRQVAATVPVSPAKFITVKAAGWQIECERIVRMDEREMILDGNVTMSMRNRDVTVQAGRVRVNLTDGSIHVDAAD